MAQLASPAIQMGAHAARQIVRIERSEPTLPFHYFDKGTMATIGNQSAVVQLSTGQRITGSPAWFAWVALHLWYLLGGRNRVQTLINLAYRYLIWPRQTGAIIGDVVEPPSQHLEGGA